MVVFIVVGSIFVVVFGRCEGGGGSFLVERILFMLMRYVVW